MRTYSKKKRPAVTPIRIFTDEEKDDVPEMKNSTSPCSIVSTPPPSDAVQHLNDDLLARSPARSDASSSMKSRESALERRVSLLLRSESPAEPDLRCSSPPYMFDHSPCALPTAPEEPEDEDQDQDQTQGPVNQHARPQHKRLSSFAAVHFFSPKKTQKMQDRVVSSPCKRKTNKLTKRMSAAVHNTATAGAKTGTRTPDNASPAPSSKSNSSIRSSIDAGLKVLTRAKTTLIRKTSPLVHRVYPKNRDKLNPELNVGSDRETRLCAPTEHDLEGFVNSPTSMFFDTSNSPEAIRTPSGRPSGQSHSRPQTSQTLPLLSANRSVASPTPTYSENLSPLAQHPVALSPDLDELAKRGTTRLRLAPSIRANGRRRLSVTDASKPGLLDVPARHSIDSIRSVSSAAASSIASQAPDHELRRTTMRIKREGVVSAILCDSSDRQSIVSSKRPKSSGRLFSLKRSHDDVFVDPPETNPGIAGTLEENVGARAPLSEINANKKISCEDMGTLKTAKALRMSVSPKVKEVFNKIPRRVRSSNSTRVAGLRVSRSSSKASRVLGHHFSSKEPLRPEKTSNGVRQDRSNGIYENAKGIREESIDGVRGQSMSDDELAL